MEACEGKKHDVKINKMEKCSECNGTGAAAGSSPQTCPDCNGSGTVKVTQRTPFGMISSSKTCSRCGGKGTIISNPCKKCGGTARVRVSKTINVDIPAGIDDGQILRVGGQGDNGLNGGPSGDLNVVVSVRPHRCLSETVPIFTAKSLLLILRQFWATRLPYLLLTETLNTI